MGLQESTQRPGDRGAAFSLTTRTALSFASQHKAGVVD